MKYSKLPQKAKDTIKGVDMNSKVVRNKNVERFMSHAEDCKKPSQLEYQTNGGDWAIAASDYIIELESRNLEIKYPKLSEEAKVNELKVNLKLRNQDVYMLQCEIGDMCEIQANLEDENKELKEAVRRFAQANACHGFGDCRAYGSDTIKTPAWLDNLATKLLT